jgi:hypothetical protein
MDAIVGRAAKELTDDPKKGYARVRAQLKAHQSLDAERVAYATFVRQAIWRSTCHTIGGSAVAWRSATPVRFI